MRDLQSVLDAVLDGVIVVDRDGKIERLNAEASRILETSIDASGGGGVDGLLSDDHPLAKLVARVMGDGGPARQDDVRIARRFDLDVAVDLAVSPLPEPEGGVVVVLRDRTILNTLQAQVDDEAQLVSYGHIAAGIAHEVKNPLGGIRGAGELLEMKSEDERSKRTAQLIVREADRITALVDELMVFARGEELDIRPANLHQLLDGVLDLVTMDPLFEGVSSVRAYDPSIPEIEVDPDRLTQVFLNLVRNALQAMESVDDRHLTIRTGMSLDHRLTDARGRHVPTVVVSVRDSGPGIPTEHLDRLGTPFFTTRVKGTGLGLAVSSHWITRHGGTLRFTAPSEGGTLVRVALPLGGPSATAAEPAAHPGEGK